MNSLENQQAKELFQKTKIAKNSVFWGIFPQK